MYATEAGIQMDNKWGKKYELCRVTLSLLKTKTRHQ